MAAARGLPEQILFLVLSLLSVAATEQMALQVAVDRAVVHKQAQLAMEHQGKATMEAQVTTTVRVMLLAAVVVEQAQLV